MNDIIKILPESVANQIAAGEVVQRPSSVVKELLENAVDAKSSTITLIIKDGGKTLIQVKDNGIGMSKNDAIICFNRHATSKISNANDLFKISSKGFRGEALASISAISHLRLITKQDNFELGTDGSATVSTQAMNAEGTMIESYMSDIDSATTSIVLTVTCGLTYQVSIVLYNNDGS